MTYMLDTNICIYAMKNKPEHVLQRLKKELNSGICISSITLAELEYGMKHSSNPAKNEQALLRFLIPLSILPFGAAAASEYPVTSISTSELFLIANVYVPFWGISIFSLNAPFSPFK